MQGSPWEGSCPGYMLSTSSAWGSPKHTVKAVGAWTLDVPLDLHHNVLLVRVGAGLDDHEVDEVDGATTRSVGDETRRARSSRTQADP